MTLRKICKKCVLPESKPDIWLNGEGGTVFLYEKNKIGKEVMTV